MNRSSVFGGSWRAAHPQAAPKDLLVLLPLVKTPMGPPVPFASEAHLAEVAAVVRRVERDRVGGKVNVENAVKAAKSRLADGEKAAKAAKAEAVAASSASSITDAVEVVAAVERWLSAARLVVNAHVDVRSAEESRAAFIEQSSKPLATAATIRQAFDAFCERNGINSDDLVWCGFDDSTEGS